MSNNVTRIVTMATPYKGREMPFGRLASAAQVASPVISAGVPIHQVLGVCTTSVSINVPHLTANKPVDLPWSIILTTGSIPFTFRLAPNSQAHLEATAQLNATPTDGTTIVSVPVITASYGSPPSTSASSGWVLQPGQTYSAPQAAGTVRVFSPTGAAAQTGGISLVVQARLIGIPSG